MKKGMKIAIVSWAEMGHFIPVSNIGEELLARGHEVTFITHNYGKERCTKLVEAFGARCVTTNDSFVKEDLHPPATGDYGWVKLTPLI